jgi:tryptophan-rich sensory protein
MRHKDSGALALLLLATASAALIGGVASVRAAEFYGQLSKPEWAPPAGVFGQSGACSIS